MKNQTVEQVYIEQQMIKEGNIPKGIAQGAMETPEQKEAIKIVNSLTQSLQQAHQSVKQAQTAHPLCQYLSQADQLLSSSTQQIKQLETIKLSISNGTKVQLKQLNYQIEMACGTLGMIQQAIGKGG